ncbi:9068_t:CDS:2 [Ambispora leptoticha]|uniref:9068_t:CDS:1 n=1 Tax=Ambispora leptoticha TaxID=144679 RepID=A0A9N9E8W8_9GLOM|nr:9068_t:CDS:2 [Ambispora leptoticha]
MDVIILWKSAGNCSCPEKVSVPRLIFDRKEKAAAFVYFVFDKLRPWSLVIRNTLISGFYVWSCYLFFPWKPRDSQQLIPITCSRSFLFTFTALVNMLQYELNDMPADTISSIVFSPTNSDLLLVSSWDKTQNILYVAGILAADDQVKNFTGVASCEFLDTKTTNDLIIKAMEQEYNDGWISWKFWQGRSLRPNS